MSNAKLIGGVVIGAAVGAAIMAGIYSSKNASCELPAETPAAVAEESPEVSVVDSVADAVAVESGSDEVVLDTQLKKRSYAIGLNMANSIPDSVKIDAGAITEGVRDSVTDKDARMSEEEIMEIMTTLMEEERKESQKKALMNVAEGKIFMSVNGEKEGVVTLDSGLQYKVIREGDGEVPTAESTVEVNYRGTLIDGTEFDSSYARGKTATFPVTGVIKGWSEALQLMKEGSKWELYVPSELAYGARGVGSSIPPNATLIFEFELLNANVE